MSDNKASEKNIGMYTALQNRLIVQYDVIICDGMIDGHKCQNERYSAHRCAYHNGSENRRIRNWKQENTVLSTFVLLHEIGHLQEHYEYRVEDEYEATVWAMEMCRELHIPIDRKTLSKKQIDIIRWYDRYAEKYAGADLFGIKRPEWLKDREFYNVVRVYDRMFGNKSGQTAVITQLAISS